MDELWKKTNKTLGDLGFHFGEVVEHLIVPNLIEKFNDIGFDFRTASSNSKFYDIRHQGIAEVDVLLENANVAGGRSKKQVTDIPHGAAHAPLF